MTKRSSPNDCGLPARSATQPSSNTSDCRYRLPRNRVTRRSLIQRCNKGASGGSQARRLTSAPSSTGALLPLLAQSAHDDEVVVCAAPIQRLPPSAFLDEPALPVGGLRA